jgi:hypothetical protein
MIAGSSLDRKDKKVNIKISRDNAIRASTTLGNHPTLVTGKKRNGKMLITYCSKLGEKKKTS